VALSSISIFKPVVMTLAPSAVTPDLSKSMSNKSLSLVIVVASSTSMLIAEPAVKLLASINKALAVVFASASTLKVEPSNVRLASDVTVPSPSSVNN
jgi:hypothetical protein